jgi:hypothetical protein
MLDIPDFNYGPCPFCNSMNVVLLFREEPVLNHDPVQLFWVECVVCEARGPLYGDRDASIGMWRRASDLVKKERLGA